MGHAPDDPLSGERQLRDVVLSAINEGVVAIDANGRFVFANDAAARLGGFPSAQALMAAERGDIFARWNAGVLESFLVELTAHVCHVIDAQTGTPLVDVIQDKAGQKGTGLWTAQVALELGVPIPTIAAALDARVLSSMKDQRVSASSRFDGPVTSEAFTASDRELIVDSVADALHASRICSYAQGMALIAAGSAHYDWHVNLSEMARIWKGGCIIRARVLDDVRAAFTRDPALVNLLMDERLGRQVQDAQAGWRRIAASAVAAGIPIPAMTASLAYFDSYRTARLPQNLTQAQRDAFGAHTFERIERPGFIHADWGLRPDAD